MITLELHVPTFKLGAIDIAAIKLHSEENDSKDLLLHQSSLSISSVEPLQYIRQIYRPKIFKKFDENQFEIRSIRLQLQVGVK